MPYAELLDNFEAVSQRVEDANNSHKVLIALGHEEGSLAESTSKAVHKMSRPLETVRESGTLRDAYGALAAHHDEVSRIHTDLAKRLNDDVCQPQLKARKDCKHHNVKKVAEGEKLVKELRKAQQRADDAKNKARQKRLEAESATAHHEKARNDASFNPKQLGSIASKEKSALKDADKAEAEHESAVAKLDATRASYEQGMQAILEDMESQELSRISEVKRGLETYVEAHREALEALSRNLESFSASVQAIHNAADVSAFVEATLAAVENGEEVGKRRKSIFRRGTTTATSSPMAGGGGGSGGSSSAAAAGAAGAAVGAGTATASTSQQSSVAGDSGGDGTEATDSPTADGQEENGNDGASEPSKVAAAAGAATAAATAAFAGAASLMSSGGGAKPAGEAEEAEEAKDVSSEFQQEAAEVDDADAGNPFGDDTGAATPAPLAATDSGNPFGDDAGAAAPAAAAAGADWGDAFANEPQAAPEPAAAPATDPFGADPFGSAAEATGAGAGAGAGAAVAAPAADGAEPVLCKAKALFDYASTGPGELSFSENQILTIYAKNESGWWEGVLEDSGERGVCPSNYLEELP